MSGNIADTYAVVDKSKKTSKNKNRPFPQEPPSHDPVMDVYAVVDKTSKSKPVPQSVDDQNTYDAVAPDNLYYNTVTNTTTEDAEVYDSASAPTYSQLDRNQVPPSIPFQGGIPMVQCNSRPRYEFASLRKQEDIDSLKERKFCTVPVGLLACLIILIIVFVAAFVALIVAFALIANLRSEIESIKKLESPTSSLKSTMPSETDALSILRANITKLDSKLLMFSNQTEQVFDDLQNNVTLRTSKLEDEANNLTRIQNKFRQMQAAVEMKISNHENNLGAQLVEYNLNITQLLNIVMQETFINISSARDTTQRSVDELTAKIVRNIQELYVFESCNAINTFSLPFSSGEYTIKTSTGHTIMSCMLFPSCNNMTGGWRRVAYLNTDDTIMPQCPNGLEARTTPPSCRLPASIVDGCSSVKTYQTEGSYNCISGRIIAHQSGNPDAFTKGDGNTRSETTLDGNYVDGVSLTYGNNSNHIWTFTAAIINTGQATNCYKCNNLKPSFVADDYSCEVTPQCFSNTNVCHGPLWNGGEQCDGGSTFYRHLLEPTSADIEMRVCRDQVQTDEDFSLNVIEIYVR